MSGIETQKATNSRIHASKISRLINKPNTHLSLGSLAHLVCTVGKNDHQRVELLAAHLKDRCTGPGSQQIQITITKPAPTKFKSDHDRLIDFISQLSSQNPSIAKVLLHLAENSGFKP